HRGATAPLGGDAHVHAVLPPVAELRREALVGGTVIMRSTGTRRSPRPRLSRGGGRLHDGRTLVGRHSVGGELDYLDSFWLPPGRATEPDPLSPFTRRAPPGRAGEPVPAATDGLRAPGRAGSQVLLPPSLGLST